MQPAQQERRPGNALQSNAMAALTCLSKSAGYGNPLLGWTHNIAQLGRPESALQSKLVALRQPHSTIQLLQAPHYKLLAF